MSAVYTHKFRLHGANIRANEQNTAAAVVFDDGSTREFVSEPAKGKEPQAEPTATMQAIQAAKAAMLARDEAELAERLEKRRAAIEAAQRRNTEPAATPAEPPADPKPTPKRKA